MFYPNPGCCLSSLPVPSWRLEDCFGELGCLSRWADRTAQPCQNLSHSLEDSHQRAAALRPTPYSKEICKFFCFSAFHNRLAGREGGELVEGRRGTSGPMRVLYLLFLWGKTLRPGLEPYSRVTCMVSIAPYPKDPQSQHPKGRLGSLVKLSSLYIPSLGTGPLTASGLDVGFRTPRLEHFLSEKWEYLPPEASRKVCTLEEGRHRLGYGK